MFYIEEIGGGSFRIAQVPEHHRDRHFVTGLTLEESRVALLRAYRWPEEMVVFAVQNGLEGESFRFVREEMEQSRRHS